MRSQRSVLLALLPALISGVAATTGPCDIFDRAPENTPCVAAHSVTRALYGSYDGPLYQVKRTDTGETKDINVEAPGGVADSLAQDSFCGSGPCVIWRIYDQSEQQNHLDIAPPGGAHRAEDRPTNATKDPLQLGGRRVYSAYFEGGMGYRRDNTTGIATGDEAETIYMVTSGVHFNNAW